MNTETNGAHASFRTKSYMTACILLLFIPALLVAQETLCWKQNYTRGTGQIGTGCPAGQELQVGLCYPACQAGYVGQATLCWQACPSGFSDMGVSCTKPAATSSAGYPWKFGDTAFDFDTGPRARCEADNGAGNCYRSGAIWYPKCKANFHKVGDLVCTPDCPAGMRDDGAFCAKKVAARGAGTTLSCGAGLTGDAGLCYPTCAPDFDGAGPVCWSKCSGKYPSPCGAGCAVDQNACAAAVGDMVMNTVGVAINILSLVAGGPGIGAAAKSAAAAGRIAAEGTLKVGAEGLEQGLKIAVKAYAKTYGKEFVKSMIKNQFEKTNLYWTGTSLLKMGSLKAFNEAAKEYGTMKDAGEFDYSMLTILDPTGISSAVLAFAKYGSCSVDDFVADQREMDFGSIATAPATRTVKLAIQQPTTITGITTPPFQNASIVPTADCIGKHLLPGQSCTINVQASAPCKLDGEIRIYTTEFDVIPFVAHVTGNSNLPTPCAMESTTDEAVNLTSITGVWAWNNDLNRKVIIQSDGALSTVNNWAGTGTVTVKDPLRRTFDVKIGTAAPVTVQMSEMHDSLTGGVAASRRNWDTRCDPGSTFFAGLCYDPPMGYMVTAPGFIGKPCPTGWRDDGSSCWPAWTGPEVAAQAKKDGQFTFKYPILVTDCTQLSQAKGQNCPANFSGPAVCTCAPKPTLKDVRSLIGKLPH